MNEWMDGISAVAGVRPRAGGERGLEDDRLRKSPDSNVKFSQKAKVGVGGGKGGEG